MFVPLGLCVLYLFFSACSVAITKSRSSKLRDLNKAGFPGAKRARVVLRNADRMLLVCQLGLFLSTLLAGIWLGKFLQSNTQLLSLDLSFGKYPIPIFVFQALIVFGFCIGCVALVTFARALAVVRPNRTLSLLSVPILLFAFVAEPFATGIKKVLDATFAVLGMRSSSERELAASPEEISEIVEVSTKAGQVEEDEKEMILHVFSFSETLAREVMTPRKEIIWADERCSKEDLAEIFRKEGLSRIVICDGELDKVKGIILAKDFLNLLSEPQGIKVPRSIIRPVQFVPSNKNIDELLILFRENRSHMAVVVDEHGGVDGIITMEDLVEELVGEIFDEHDSPSEEIEIIERKNGEIVVDGGMLIDDLNSDFGLHLPDGPYDTVAGLLLHELGRIPEQGEQISFDDINLVLKAEKIEDTAIEQVRVIADRISAKDAA